MRTNLRSKTSRVPPSSCVAALALLGSGNSSGWDEDGSAGIKSVGAPQREATDVERIRNHHKERWPKSWHSCGRKAAYRDEYDAWRVAKSFDQQNVYLCTVCNRWHIATELYQSKHIRRHT